MEVKNDELAPFLFQVLRELLLNVVKHAEVERARLAVRSEGATLIFVVSDDGAGFDVTELGGREVEHHRGLRGLGLQRGTCTPAP